VGVRVLSPGIPEVPYAVDDAIDLAHLLVFPKDPRRRLLLAHQVQLALSGEPRKPESKARLARLVHGGARVGGATRAEIESWLGEADAGIPALLWVSFATHGRSLDREDHLLTADSPLPTQRVLDRVARRPAALRLVVLDACREAQLSSLPALELTGNVESNGPLAVLRARVGGPLFDDDESRQGVFTGALLDGLDCRAATDDRGHVTVAFLAAYVNLRVTTWMRERLGLTIDEKLGVEAYLGGTAAEQAVVRCHECPRAGQPDRLATREDRLEVFAADGRPLWAHATSGLISQAVIADLDGDGSREVALAVSVGGEDAGRVLCFTCSGKRLWDVDTYAASPYGAYSGRMAARKLVVADLFRDRYRQIIALSIDAQAWLPSRLTVLDHEGKLLGSYWHPGHLEHVAVGSASDTSPQRIVAAGINNNLRGAFADNDYVDSVFLLDPRNVRGQAPPHLPGSEAGSQLWYRAIVPADPQALPPELLQLGSIEILDRDRDGNREIHVRMTEGHSATFDFRGCPIGSGRGDGARGEIAVAFIGGDLGLCRNP
jgi:hypothetical protein